MLQQVSLGISRMLHDDHGHLHMTFRDSCLLISRRVHTPRTHVTGTVLERAVPYRHVNARESLEEMYSYLSLMVHGSCVPALRFGPLVTLYLLLVGWLGHSTTLLRGVECGSNLGYRLYSLNRIRHGFDTIMIVFVVPAIG